jgi:hypothetical protein
VTDAMASLRSPRPLRLWRSRSSPSVRGDKLISGKVVPASDDELIGGKVILASDDELISGNVILASVDIR